MSDKISLEHLIRNIASGNFTPSDEPKVTLEHAIKNVVRKESSFAAKDSKPVDEDVGGLVGSGTGGVGKLHAESGKKKPADEEDSKLPGGEDKMDEAVGSMGTDKFQGNQFKSIRSATPHIKPPGPLHGHSQAPENAARQRSIAKEKTSMTMSGNVTEGIVNPKNIKAGVEAAKTIEKTAEKGMDSLSSMLRTYTPQNLPAVVNRAQTVVRSLERNLPAVAERPLPAAPKNLPAVKTPEPIAATKPQTPVAQPELVTAPKVATDTKVAVDSRVTTQTKPQLAEPPTVTQTATKTAEKAATPVTTATATATKTPVTPITATRTATRTPAVAPTRTTTATPKPFTSKIASVGDKSRGGIRLPNINVPHDFNYHVDLEVPYKRKVHFAKKQTRYTSMKEEKREDIEFVPRKDAGDRKKLEYVGRKNTKQETLGRNASVKNVIDEGKKLASVVKKVVKDKERFEDSFGGKTKVYDNPPVTINPPEKRIDMNVHEGLAKTTAKTIGAVTAASGLVGGAATAYGGGTAKEIGQGALDTAKSVFTEPYRKYKEGDYRGAALDVLTTVNPGAAAAEIGGMAASTELGQKVGQKIGQLPGAKTAADYMRKAGEVIGVRDSSAPPPLSTDSADKAKTLAPGEGIKLERKQKVKPLAAGEPIKLK